MYFLGSTNPSARCTSAVIAWFLVSRCNDNDQRSEVPECLGLGPAPVRRRVRKYPLLLSRHKLHVFDRHLCLATWSQASEINRPCDRRSMSDASTLAYPNMISWWPVLTSRSSLPSCTPPAMSGFCLLMRTTTSWSLWCIRLLSKLLKSSSRPSSLELFGTLSCSCSFARCWECSFPPAVGFALLPAVGSALSFLLHVMPPSELSSSTY